MKLSTRLLRWYDKHGRDLPWRKTKNPYRILVSEIMLQQTQVDRVKDFYRRWLRQFPNWKTLAKASNADVIRAWAGLGYNRRALALRDIARQVVESGVPKTEEDWLKLKGIGPYTAAAISILAQDKKTLPVDTNIRRLLGRLLLGKVYPDMKRDSRVQRRGQALLEETERHADLVQSFFDLASSHCVKIPDCSTCPMRGVCPSAQKFLSGKVQVPKRMTPKSRERIHSGKKYPDRIYRGRILKLAREAKTGFWLKDVGKSIDTGYDGRKDKKWLRGMIDRLEKDNLVIIKNNKLYLP